MLLRFSHIAIAWIYFWASVALFFNIAYAEAYDPPKRAEIAPQQATEHVERVNTNKRLPKIEKAELTPSQELKLIGEDEGLTGYDIAALDRVMYCESKYNPKAANAHSSAKGLFQFLDSSWRAWGKGSVYNQEQNIRAAVRYYKHSGLRPWSACVY